MSDAAIALNRFGLGARSDEAVPADPKRWLRGQIERFEARPAALAALPSREAIASGLADYFQELRGMGAIEGGAKQPRPSAAAMPAASDDDGLRKSVRRFVRTTARDHYVVEVGARTRAALTSPTPFIERLVHFWANHFAVSADKLAVIGLAGMLEFEAIRPHVLGRFGDMLLAVEQHPAMLLYLDQAQSVGPGSMLGSRIAARGKRKVGLNENLAREILELHTLGVRSGYAQSDVTEFARAMTGWTVAGIARGPAARIVGTRGAPGDFVFAERVHEPGTRTILGKSYAQDGEAQARAVLADLAVHPATAKHIAVKLARHFAGDVPPPALVARLERAFLESGGALPRVYAALIDSPEAWAAAPPKFKTPWDWGVSTLRAIGSREVPDMQAVQLMNQLGQPVWRPGSPAGWDDLAASWAGPDALVRRVEAAERIAGRVPSAVDARLLAPRLLAGTVSAATTQAIARADSPGQGLALMLVAPEFLRR